MTRRPLALLAVLAVLAGVLAAVGGVGYAAFTDSETNPQQVTAAATFPGLEPRLKVQSQNFNPTDTNQITLGLQVENTGSAALDLTRVTLTYWFTNDYGTGGLDSRCNYVPAPLDCSKAIRGVDVVIPARTGGDRYLQMGFTEGTLAPGAKTGAIQVQVFRSNGGSGPFDQSDDYSHTTRTTLGDAPNVTGYLDGTLVWGSAPPERPKVPALRIRYTDLDGDPKNELMAPGLIVDNTGTTALELSDITLRYWFSNGKLTGEFQTACDYAALGCGVITHHTVAGVAKASADQVLEVGFSAGTLQPGSSTGEIRLRANHVSFADLNEKNDYSHGSTGPFVEWPKVTGYAGDTLLWGNPP